MTASRQRLTFSIACLLLARVALPVVTDDKVRSATGVDRVHAELGLTGTGVLVAILDRGIDVTHSDLRNPDATTRFLALFDMTDDTGAGAPGNSFGLGTIYERAAIDAALSGGAPLAFRDALGEGTAVAGLAAGNGRGSDGLYRGMAPDAQLLGVKISGGAPAHGSIPEEPTTTVRDIEAALDFVLQRANDLGLPIVVVVRPGVLGGPPDGTSEWARAVDARFGAGKPGRVFVTATGNDGGTANHASGRLSRGQTIDLNIHKGSAGPLRLEFWYDGADRHNVEIVSPSGTFGPYVAPQTNGQQTSETEADFSYFHNGTTVDFWNAGSSRREIVVDFGPEGDYTVRLTGTAVVDGRFQGYLSPARLFEGMDNRFDTFVVEGSTIWDMAAAQNNVAPNAYILRDTWTDLDGMERRIEAQGMPGELWAGSGIGPTFDGRFGVTTSAPGGALIAPYATGSYLASLRENLIQDDGQGRLYGILQRTEAAAAVTAGIAALMLQANPLLDALDARIFLQQTARRDSLTGTSPNSRFGYGKIDAYAVVARVLGIPNLTEVEGALPRSATLFPNYPNPFSASTTLRFALPARADVRLVVYDLLGREVAVPVEEVLAPGVYETSFDASRLPAGVYVYRLEAGGVTHSRALTLVR